MIVKHKTVSDTYWDVRADEKAGLFKIVFGGGPDLDGPFSRFMVKPFRSPMYIDSSPVSISGM